VLELDLGGQLGAGVHAVVEADHQAAQIGLVLRAVMDDAFVVDLAIARPDGVGLRGWGAVDHACAIGCLIRRHLRLQIGQLAAERIDLGAQVFVWRGRGGLCMGLGGHEQGGGQGGEGQVGAHGGGPG